MKSKAKWTKGIFIDEPFPNEKNIDRALSIFYHSQKLKS
jgi:hypothetical protein